MDELTAIADALYAGPADAFTDARNRAAKDVGDKDLAAQIKKLKKPSVAAWAVNLLVRRESEQIDSVLGLADQLRAAAEALDGDELRALTRQRRQLTTALASSARSLAKDAGVQADRSGRRPGRGHAHRRDARPGGGAGRAHRSGGHRVHLDRGLRARRGERGRRARVDRRAGHASRRGRGARAGRAARRTRRGSEAGGRRGRPRGGQRAARRGGAGARRGGGGRRGAQRPAPAAAGRRRRAAPAGWPRSRTTSTRSTRTSRRPRTPATTPRSWLNEAQRTQAEAEEALAKLQD